MTVKGHGEKIAPGSDRDQWILTPSSVVGVVTLDEVQLVIQPKIGVRNLLFLMDVDTRKERWNTELFEFEQDPDLLVAMVRLFIRMMERALAQGLRRDYRIEQEDLLAIRGRIDISQLAKRPRPMTSVPCVFDEFTSDIWVNRLLLAATRLSLRVPGVSTRDRRILHRREQMLDGVGEERDLLRRYERWKPSRLDQHYEPAVRVGGLLLRHLSMKNEEGGLIAPTFLLDMNELVEVFVTERLKSLLRGLLDLRGQYRTHLDRAQRVGIRPDLVFTVSGRPVFVADIKYKTVESMDEVLTSDLYQLNSYVDVLNLSSGALITCRADRSSKEGIDVVTVRNTDSSLELWPIDLTQAPERIGEDLTVIAGMILDRTRITARPAVPA